MSIIIEVAVPCPVYSLFDYRTDEINMLPGCRVSVPFGSRKVVGIVIRIKPDDVSKDLKTIEACLDTRPVISETLLLLTQWLSQYYHHPIGDCFHTVLPRKICQGEAAQLTTQRYWKLCPSMDKAPNGEKQKKIIQLLKDKPFGISQTELYQTLGACRSSLIALKKKNIIFEQDKIQQSPVNEKPLPVFKPNQEQQLCIDAVLKGQDKFNVFFLQGITGSGKTEVYLHLAKHILHTGKQILILIPEISLSNQLVSRFRQHLTAHIEVMNSAMTDSKRKQAWLLAKEGLTDILIGTRSAVFTPFKNIGLIIIDEEHDPSFKQQEGLRYHARNVALMRAKKAKIPVLLGSATPSLESLYQVERKHYQLLTLSQRATGAQLPEVRLIDDNGPKAQKGLSSELYHAIKKQLEQDNQVLIFINRRGYAPVLMCHDCQWQATCKYCDARMIIHQARHSLCCHHCGYMQRLIEQCPQCQSQDIASYGIGTEQIEQFFQHAFPDVPVLRIDRDSTQKVHAFSDIITTIREGGAKILVGTQMLAKGHDFHDVTLVGILDADQGLMSADFRATESLAQLVTQVTGRAGRGKKSGVVYIQTSQPEHPFWHDLIEKGYDYLAHKLLQERKQAGLPPASYLSLIRAEYKHEHTAIDFLTQVQAILTHQQQNVQVMGPVPSAMEKKAGRYRAQLLLSCAQRKPIHQLLDEAIDKILSLRLARKVRWSIDIDPQDLL